MKLHEKYGSWLKRSYFKTSPFNWNTAEQVLLLCVIASVRNELDQITIKQDIISTDKILHYGRNIVNLFKDKYNYELAFFTELNLNTSHFRGCSSFKVKDIHTMNFEKMLDGQKCGLEGDILGYIYSFCLFNYEHGTMQNNCSYYTSTETIHNLLKAHFTSGKKAFDPFCGAGRMLFNECGIKVSGSDKDKFAVDIANLNSWLLEKVFVEDLEVCPFRQQDFYEITEKHDYVFTNIPFDKSIKKEAEIVNKLGEIVNCKAIVIIPLGHFDRMIDKNLLKDDWNLIKRLDSTEFEPFAKVGTEVIELKK